MIDEFYNGFILIKNEDNNKNNDSNKISKKELSQNENILINNKENNDNYTDNNESIKKDNINNFIIEDYFDSNETKSNFNNSIKNDEKKENFNNNNDNIISDDYDFEIISYNNDKTKNQRPKLIKNSSFDDESAEIRTINNIKSSINFKEYENIDEKDIFSYPPYFERKCLLYDNEGNEINCIIAIGSAFNIVFKLDFNCNSDFSYPNSPSMLFQSTIPAKVPQKFQTINITKQKNSNNISNKKFNNYFYSFSLISIISYTFKKNLLSNYYCTIDLTLNDFRKFRFMLDQQGFFEFDEIVNNYSNPFKQSGYYRYASYFKKEFIEYMNIKLGKQEISNKKANKIVNEEDNIENNKEKKDSLKLYDNHKHQLDFQKEFFINQHLPNSNYILFSNEKFKFCPTYPNQFVIPKSINQKSLESCAEFREKRRIPVLTYFYEKNGTSIWRSSQTKGGFYGKNEGDKVLINAICGKRKMIIYDARPVLNAFANKMMGAGYEDPSDYENDNIEVKFLGIPNIHVVRKSFQIICTNITYCLTSTSIFSSFSSSLWPDYLSLLLSGSVEIAEKIRGNYNILIHCSDGWDRTSQLCALSQIFLEERFRTIEGFEIVIEKDFASFGFMFGRRNGMGMEGQGVNDNSISPIFIQFLDCVYQLLYQNPNKFEFNSYLLYTLAIESYMGRFGTFLFNNDKEREKYADDTVSIWNYVELNKEKFINKNYIKNDNVYEPLKFNSRKIKLWDEFFLRYDYDSEYNNININDDILKNKGKINDIDINNIENDDNIINININK